MEVRLNKFLAEKVGLSRRQADDLIASGKVLINGSAASLGARIRTDSDGRVLDKVICDGLAVSDSATEYIYLMLNKPDGYVCSRKKQGEAETIYAILPPEYQGLKSVGRLDRNTSGLLILTNDGDFAFQMTHPKFVKNKVYLATLNRPLAPFHQQMISDFGVELEDGRSQLALTSLNDAKTEFQIEMSEGRNRQIRRTFAALGYKIEKLHRVAFGKYTLSDLEPGEYKIIEK